MVQWFRDWSLVLFMCAYGAAAMVGVVVGIVMVLT